MSLGRLLGGRAISIYKADGCFRPLFQKKAAPRIHAGAGGQESVKTASGILMTIFHSSHFFFALDERPIHKNDMVRINSKYHKLPVLTIDLAEWNPNCPAVHHRAYTDNC